MLKTLDWIFGVLLVIGGLNWGLMGFFDFDAIAAIFGGMIWPARIIYMLVGISALYEVAMVRRICHRWAESLHKPAHV